MSRKLSGIIYVFILICISSLTFANDMSLSDLQSNFYGTWFNKDTETYYTFSEDRIVVNNNQEGRIFNIIIESWNFIINDHENSSENYPHGFEIFGIIEEGFWTGTRWIRGNNMVAHIIIKMYISIDKNSLMNYFIEENREFIWIKQ